MAEHTGALATFKEVVDGLLMKADIPEGKSVVVEQIAIDGYRELNLVVLDEGRVVDLFTMNDNYIIDLPEDFIKLNDIYIPCDNMIWSLTRRKEIPIVTEISGGSEVIPDDWGGGRDIPHGYGTYFQTEGGRNYGGYYEIDERKRRIHFRNVNRSEVMLDYVSSGIKRSETTYIPMSAKPALEAYIMMECSIFGIIPKSEYQVHKRRYEEQKGLLRMLDFNFTEFTDAVYRSFNGSYRR